ncbi:MAG: 2-amino-4-hydroxy-6-hydroxymethyldihydropteridine diphosphokinase [Pseudoflavonifractor sp.]|nr:2-amino-4-hydroxy-6-hydroxymethyldihydropteridine diphosphokinase [Pseudoflavonifractor sp.]
MTGMVFGVGGNVGDRQRMVTDAISWVREMFGCVTASSVYETPALNGRDADYLNVVVYAMTDKDMETVNMMLKEYERRCGRTPQSKSRGEIPIDIDIVVWDGKVIRDRDFKCDYFCRGYHELLSLGLVMVDGD